MTIRVKCYGIFTLSILALAFWTGSRHVTSEIQKILSHKIVLAIQHEIEEMQDFSGRHKMYQKIAHTHKHTNILIKLFFMSFYC